MRTWEYKRVGLPDKPDISDWLDSLDKEGWELVQIYQDPRYLNDMFKLYPVGIFRRAFVKQSERVEAP